MKWPRSPLSPEEIDVHRAQVAASAPGLVCEWCGRVIDPTWPMRERRRHRTGACV